MFFLISINFLEEKVKSRWKILKDSFESEYTKINSGKSTNWQFYDLMDFLEVNYRDRSFKSQKKPLKSTKKKAREESESESEEMEKDEEEEEEMEDYDEKCARLRRKNMYGSTNSKVDMSLELSNKALYGNTRTVRNIELISNLRSHALKIHPSLFIKYKVECFQKIDHYKNNLTPKETEKDLQENEKKKNQEEKMYSKDQGKLIEKKKYFYNSKLKLKKINTPYMILKFNSFR